MRIEILSDHAGQQLRETEERARIAEAQLARQRLGYQRAHAAYLAARLERPLWRRWLGLPTAAERRALARTRAAWQEVELATDTHAGLRRRVAQQTAGAWAEDALSRILARLDDDWVALRGYHNRRGETDHVLVGPPGLWAVEVKRRRVRLHVTSDRWWYERLDRHGRVVDTGAAVDAAGRSWGQQVRDVAGDLAAWLTRNGYPVPVRTAVVLLHEQAELGRCRGLSVDLLTCQPERLLAAIDTPDQRLSARDRQEIVRLIHRDHRYHATRRQS